MLRELKKNMCHKQATGMQEMLNNLAKHRHVLWNFVQRDLKVKYRGTFLGYLWSLLEPFSLVAVYWFVFVVVARRGGSTYPLTVILGILPYHFFSVVITLGAAALSSNASLIRRVYLPRELFVVSTVLSNLVVFGFSLLSTTPFLLLYWIVPTWKILFLPLSVILLMAFTTGVALILSCANTMYRDVSYIVQVLLRVGFYISPVIYPLEMVPEKLHIIYLLNPLAVYLSMLRSAVMGTDFIFGWFSLLLSVFSAFFSLWLGAVLFKTWQARAVKFL